MDWDRVQGLCQQAAGKAWEDWGRLIGSERISAAGRRVRLAGLIRRHYGVAMDEARRLLAVCEHHAGGRAFAGARRGPRTARAGLSMQRPRRGASG